MAKVRKIEEPFGPNYPKDLGSVVARFRRRAHGGLRSMSTEDRQAYGAAVEKAILAKQKSEAHHGFPAVNPHPNCASGTIYNDGGDIHRAIQARQRQALAMCPSQERRARTPKQWRDMYAEAMEEKRAGETRLAA